MSREKIGKTYANALFQAIDASSNVETANELLEVLKNFSSVWEEERELKSLINNPAIAISEKESLLLDIVKALGTSSEHFINFVKLINENKRVSEINKITESFQVLLDELNSSLSFTVTTASEIDADEKQELKNLIESQVNANKIEITWLVDSRLIGGVQIKQGDKVFDTSIASQIEKVRKALVI